MRPAFCKRSIRTPAFCEKCRPRRCANRYSALAHTLFAVLLPCLIAPSAQAELPVPCGACGAGLSHFVTTGSANYSVSGNVGTIQQQTDRAILNWQSFNVGSGDTVNFKQPSSTSATLNRIHQQDPSRILGSVNANGQIFLLNQNGLIFGKDAKVNTQSLTASTLNVSDNVFNTLGITGAINADPSAGATAALPAFDGTSNTSARIAIESGAQIKATDRVLIVAPEVVNGGTIETPGGQTILAGSKDKVYLATDKDLRGLLVEVDTGGSVTNLGQILTERGNTTLVGLAVNQSGRVQATTTVNVNGSIRLLARDRATPVNFATNNGVRTPVASRSGTLTLGPNSVTAVLPSTDGATAVDAQPQTRSRIEAMGHTIQLKSGAQIRAPGGQVALTATSRPDLPLSGGNRTSKVFLEAGSSIDVSGDSSALVPMARNQGTLRLFGNELADVPVQRNGILRGQDITVDLRKGTAVADVSKLYAEVKRTVNERLATGGTITLGSEGDIVLQPQSALDFAGGQIRYLDGYIETTRLLRAGRVIDIAEANPNVVYDGIFGSMDVLHRKWGVAESFRITQNGASSIFQPGYVEGKDAGVLNITGNLVALNGELNGHAVVGAWQRERPGNVVGAARPYDEFPLGGKLILAKGGDVGATNVVFAASRPGDRFEFETALPDGLPVTIAQSLFQDSGVTRLDVTSVGRLIIPENVALDLGNDGELMLTATRIQLDGRVVAAGGTIELEATQFSGTRGTIDLGRNAVIDVSGRWVNDRADVFADRSGQAAPLAINAGTVKLVAEGDLTLAPGSLIEASAGAWRDNDGIVRFGSAGSIDLRSAIPAEATITELVLGGELRAFGFDAGGSLRLDAAAFVLGGGAATGVALAPDFFTEHGFGTFNLRADRGSIELLPGAIVRVLPRNRQLLSRALTAVSGTGVDDLSELVLLPVERRAATQFSATVGRAPGIADAEAGIDIGSGSLLEVTPEGSISLTTDSDILVAGTLRAEAGNIKLALTTPAAVNERGYRADQAIYLDAYATLDASGTARITRDQSRLRRGEVLDGGVITLHAARGYVLAAPGSVMNVDGAAGILDLPSPITPGLALASTIGSDAGSLLVRAAEGIVLGGNISGQRGGARNAGGELAITLDPNERDPGEFVANDPGNPQYSQFPLRTREIVVQQALPTIPAVGSSVPLANNGIAVVAAGSVTQGGFGALGLNAEPVITFSTAREPGKLRFDDGIVLTLDQSLNLDAAVIAATAAGTRLQAPLIAVGPTNTALRASAIPTDGAGTLTLAATHLDLRNHVVFDQLTTPATSVGLTLSSSGDIRASGIRYGGETSRTLLGSLTTRASVRLEAASIYPSTLTDYAIDLIGNNSRLEIIGTGRESTAPLSAAGTLRLSATDIVQAGTLYAPFGEITLDATRNLVLAAGSTTSTSGAGMITLFGASEFGTDWIYDLGDVVRIVDAAPAKRINLQAPSIDLAAGALIDIRGGGDLLTFEFVPGPGGRRDILAAANAEGAFAILPGLVGDFGAYDPFESSGSGIATGSTITLTDSAALPGGTYARLAPRYALLPGAFLITPVAGTRDLSVFATPTQGDGRTALVAGRLGYAGTTIESARNSGYTVESGAELRTRAEYNELLSSRFHADAGAGVPADAGQLSLSAAQGIRIAGQLAAASASGGRGALVDITADNLAVVNALTTNTTRVELLATELQQFAAANILLGGVRQRDSDGAGAVITVRARDVLLDENVNLSASEIILAATEQVRLAENSRLTSRGARRDQALASYRIVGDGAFARVSSDPQITLERSAATGTQGDLVIDSGALLDASGSITLEASRNFVFDGELAAAGGSISLTASRINLGEVTGAPGGLSLSNSQLVALRADELILNSASSVDVYGPAVLETQSLAISAAAIRGFGTAGELALFNADTMRIGNFRGINAQPAGNGTGAIRIRSGLFESTGGDFAFNGFAQTTLDLTKAYTVSADSRLNVAGDLTIAAPLMSATPGTRLGLSVVGALLTQAVERAADANFVAGLGARYVIDAASITHAGAFVLPSGSLSLTARSAPGLSIVDGGVIDLGGRDYLFGDRTVGSRGGVMTLTAMTGDIAIGAATLRVAGGTSGGEAGTVNLHAAQGNVLIDADARLLGSAQSSETQGGFVLSALGLASDFAGLNSSLNTGGFGGRRSVALGTGNLALAANDVIRANDVSLSVDGGRLDIAGRIIADSEAGGRVRLYARDELDIAAGAVLSARALRAGEAGGSIELGTAVGDLVLNADAHIDVSGRDSSGNVADSGTVHLRAPRVGSAGLRLAPPASSITGAERIDIEAFRSYSASIIDTSLLSTIGTHNDAYFANAASIMNALGVAGDARYHLLAGVEVVSTGDLTLSTDWDLFTTRFDGEAGVLSLRAAGDLRLNRSLSDGFARSAISFYPERDFVQTGDSWSYRLIGGASLTAADPIAVSRSDGDVLVANNVVVRTGTGSITVAAGGDFRLGTDSAAVYTAGVNRGTGAFSADDTEVLLRGDFVRDGGDIVIAVGGDVIGAPTNALPDYLPRVAGFFEFYAPDKIYPAVWAVDASKFQGLGTLGGGNIQLSVGGNLEGLTIALPTNALPLSMQSGDLDIAGGGDLVADIGGAVRGGTFLLGRGTGRVRTEENLQALVSNNNIAPVFALGDARLTVSARTGAVMETAFNPTIAEQDPAQGLVDQFFFPQPSYFFTYGEDAGLTFETLAQDIALSARGDRIAARYNDRLVDPILLTTLPGSLSARSFEGDIIVSERLELFPAPRGELSLLAGRDIGAQGAGAILQSDADITTLPTPTTPTSVLNGVLWRQLLLGHAAVPVHLLDTTPVEIIARSGTIGTRGLDTLSLNLAEAVNLFAGLDIANLSLAVQHTGTASRSIVHAARDITYTTSRRPADGRLSENNGLIAVAGAGALDLIGGRDIDFGASRGVESRGNLGNPALAANGADINLWTGYATPPALAAFAERYLTRSEAPYAADLQAALNAAGVTAFDALSLSLQREVVMAVLFAELEASGLESTRAGQSFARGERAIATLFPGTDYSGDLRSFLSRITTLDGGNIRALVPGGEVNAGVASTGTISKSPAELGLVVQGAGDINAYTRGDFLVNASRVFALDGGDILIWSAEGDIDAGRGARSALSIPPPTTSFDAQGNVVIEFPAAIAGSGIQAAVSTPGRAPGDVFLFAPRGVVDAGDAGISSAGNLTIAATAVLGADNISVGGASTGVPTTAVSVPVGLASASTAAGSATSAATAGATNRSNPDDPSSANDLGASLASMVTVQFLGFGE